MVIEITYSLFSYFLKYFINKILPPKMRDIVVSGDGYCCYRDVAHWKDKISDEKHEEIPRSSDSLFEKIQRYLSGNLSSRTP